MLVRLVLTRMRHRINVARNMAPHTRQMLAKLLHVGGATRQCMACFTEAEGRDWDKY
jgi:DNA-binding XRE family transcriptional regulator